MITKTLSRFFALAAFPLLIPVTGCQTLGVSLPEVIPVDLMPAAPLPMSSPGDRRYFANGRRERVTAVGEEGTVWRRSKHTSYLEDRNLILPELDRKSRLRRTTNRIEGDTSRLWPLQTGAKIWFRSIRTSTDNTTGVVKESSLEWSCTVGAAQRLTVIAGSFDVYLLDCALKDRRGRLKSKRYWYYAPDLGQVVLRIDAFPDRPSKRVEMTAFEPALPESVLTNFKDFFQETMENHLSGTGVHWEAPEAQIRLELTPTKTLKLESGRYCRNYRLKLWEGGEERQGAGLVCRDEPGRWRIPRRIEGGEE